MSEPTTQPDKPECFADLDVPEQQRWFNICADHFGGRKGDWLMLVDAGHEKLRPLRLLVTDLVGWNLSSADQSMEIQFQFRHWDQNYITWNFGQQGMLADAPHGCDLVKFQQDMVFAWLDHLLV